MFKARYQIDKFIYSNKRKSGTKSILSSFLIIIISLFIALIVACIIYKDWSLFGNIIKTIFTAPFESATYNSTISTICIFSVAAVSFLIAAKAGLFNIGISGQMMFAGVVATIIAPHLTNVPSGLSQIILLLICIISSCVLSTIIGALKAFVNVNEVVSSIMFNWIIYFIGIACLVTFANFYPGASTTTSLLNIEHGDKLVLQINGSSWMPLLIITLIVIAFAVIILHYTTFGKKIINTGLSKTAAQYAGYNAKLNQVMAMVISGAVAGILGMMVYLGYGTTMPATVATKTIPQEGFTGMSVGLIAMSNPWGVLPVGCLFGMIDASKVTFSTSYGVDPAVADLIFGIVVYGAAIISVLYFLVPVRWYLRFTKGKAYAGSYDTYQSYVSKNIDIVSSLIYYLNRMKDVNRKLSNPRNVNKINKLKYQFENIATDSQDAFKTYNINITECKNTEQLREIEGKVYNKYLYFKELDYQNFAKKVLDNTSTLHSKKPEIVKQKADARYRQMIMASRHRIDKLSKSKGGN